MTLPADVNHCDECRRAYQRGFATGTIVKILEPLALEDRAHVLESAAAVLGFNVPLIRTADSSSSSADSS